MLKIYGLYRSRATRNIWLCDELGVPFTLVPVIQADGRLARAGRRADPVALVEAAAVRAELLDQRGEHLHRVALRLVLEHGGPDVGERRVEAVVPLDGQAEGAGDPVLALDRGQLARRGGVRHRGAPLDGDAVVVAEPQQPLHALAAGIDERPRHRLRLVAADAGEVRALEQRHLARRPAGRDRADGSRLDAGHPEPAAREEEGGRQAGEPRAHDDHVERRVLVGQGVVRDGAGAVEPERGHVWVAGPDGVAPPSDSQPSSLVS